MTSILEKGGGTFEGIKLLLCENPPLPIEEAVAAAQAEVPRSNYYAEPYSEPLRRFIAESVDIRAAKAMNPVQVAMKGNFRIALCTAVIHRGTLQI